jgi:hypothetical protein
MANAICERFGETKQQQAVRAMSAAHAIMGFMPRDVAEVTIAGHCVMFHELMTDSVRLTLRGETGPMRRATRSSIVAMDNAFGKNLERLEHYQTRNAEGSRDAAEVPRAERELVDRLARHAAARKQAVPVPSEKTPVGDPPVADTPVGDPPVGNPPVGNPPVGNPPVGDTSTPREPEADGQIEEDFEVSAEPASFSSSDGIAMCLGNQEAMDALNAGDAEGFAKAMGVEAPSEAYLAAAAAKSGPFQRQAPGNHRSFVERLTNGSGADAGSGSAKAVGDEKRTPATH